jgi:hypothetical protein
MKSINNSFTKEKKPLNSPSEIKSYISRKHNDPIINKADSYKRCSSASGIGSNHKKNFSLSKDINTCKLGSFIYSMPKTKTYKETEWTKIRNKMRGSLKLFGIESEIQSMNINDIINNKSKGKSTPKSNKKLYQSSSIKNLLTNSYVNNEYKCDSSYYYGKTIGKRTNSLTVYKNMETCEKISKPQVKVEVRTNFLIYY